MIRHKTEIERGQSVQIMQAGREQCAGAPAEKLSWHANKNTPNTYEGFFFMDCARASEDREDREATDGCSEPSI